MKSTRYKDTNRLADVMALIQVLAQGVHAIRTEERLVEQLRGKPTSGVSTWTGLAESHREFFRVRAAIPEALAGQAGQAKKTDVALIWRHALFAEEADLQEGKRPALSAESTAKLLEIGVSLHDREITRSQRLTTLVPIGAAIIAGLFSILVLLVQIYSRVPLPK